MALFVSQRRQAQNVLPLRGAERTSHTRCGKTIGYSGRRDHSRERNSSRAVCGGFSAWLRLLSVGLARRRNVPSDLGGLTAAARVFPNAGTSMTNCFVLHRKARPQRSVRFSGVFPPVHSVDLSGPLKFDCCRCAPQSMSGLPHDLRQYRLTAPGQTQTLPQRSDRHLSSESPNYRPQV